MINNFITLFGRLTRDAEVKSSNSGKTYCQVTLAVDNGWGDNKKTIFVDCTAFDKTAEYLGKGTKGQQVLIQGYLNCTEKEKDGNTVKHWGVIIDNAKLIQRAEAKQEDAFADVDDEDLPF